MAWGPPGGGPRPEGHLRASPRATGGCWRSASLWVLITMAAWWTNVVKEAQRGRPHAGGVHRPAATGLILLFIVSEVMFFVAWFWIFFEMALFHHVQRPPLPRSTTCRAAWATWPPKRRRAWCRRSSYRLINTLTLLLSGDHSHLGSPRLADRRPPGARRSAWRSPSCSGCCSPRSRPYEYHHILTDHLFYSEDSSNSLGLYGSSFFMATRASMASM